MKATASELKALTRKSRRQMVVEQHPGSADVLLGMLDEQEKLEKRVVKLEKLSKGQEARIQKLMADYLNRQAGREVS